MKKIVVAILAILYMSTATGATIHIHYCMGKLVNWSLWHSKEDKCSKCGMKKTDGKDSGCCKDEHKQIKLENDQKISKIAVQFLQLAAFDIQVSFIEIPSHRFASAIEENPVSRAPLRSSDAVYIRNCSFLI